MASELVERVCTRCARRDREDGGRGSCPFPLQLRRPFIDAERNCPRFLLGDLRQPVVPIAQTGLW